MAQDEENGMEERRTGSDRRKTQFFISPVMSQGPALESLLLNAQSGLWKSVQLDVNANPQCVYAVLVERQYQATDGGLWYLQKSVHER